MHITRLVHFFFICPHSDFLLLLLLLLDVVVRFRLRFKDTASTERKSVTYGLGKRRRSERLMHFLFVSLVENKARKKRAT